MAMNIIEVFSSNVRFYRMKLKLSQEALAEKANLHRTYIVSAKYCYITHELRLHQNDRCKRFTLV